MLKYILVCTIGMLFSCSNSKEPGKSENQDEGFNVVINATTTQAYCGGAKPSEETLKELNTPKPAPNVKIYLRRGDSNNIDQEVDYQFTTDDSGRVTTSLPQGKYSIVFENKKNRSTYNELLEKYGDETSEQTAIDTTCLKTFFAEPNAVLRVKENNENTVSVNKMKRCQWTSIPCSDYKGQLPPSAPPK